MSAAELLDEMYSLGITVALDKNDLVCRSNDELPEEFITRLRSNKKAILRLLKKRKYGTPYLSETGEFRVKGGILKEPILDALLRVGASDEEIRKYIHPIGTPVQWDRWIETNTVH